MIPYSLAQIAFQWQMVGCWKIVLIRTLTCNISTDTHAVTEGALFLALLDDFDAHRFVAPAIYKHSMLRLFSSAD